MMVSKSSNDEHSATAFAAAFWIIRTSGVADIYDAPRRDSVIWHAFPVEFPAGIAGTGDSLANTASENGVFRLTLVDAAVRLATYPSRQG